MLRSAQAGQFSTYPIQNIDIPDLAVLLVLDCDVFMQRMMMMASLLSLNPGGGSVREEHSRYFYAETFCSPSIRL